MKQHLARYIDRSQTTEVRGLRILLEYFYASEIFRTIVNKKIRIISVFGSARVNPTSPEYRMAHKLGQLLYKAGFAVVTGASRGIMQAANQGVAEAIVREIIAKRKGMTGDEARQTGLYKQLLNRHSVGLSISLPMEMKSNPFVGIHATFHYFMVRKFFFGTLSSGFVACEGGWGTRDELFEMLTLVQTGKAPLMPIIYLSQDPKHLRQDLEHTVKQNYISPEDIGLIQFARTPEEAARIIGRFYRNVESIRYEREHIVRVLLKKTLPTDKKGKVEKLLRQNGSGAFVMEWKGRQLILRRYTPNSYGPLRRAIDLMNC